MRLLVAVVPARVLFVGTCGAYDPALAVGTCLWAAEALATSQDEAEGRAFRPEIETVRWPATWTPPLPFPAVSVAVPPGVTHGIEGCRVLGAMAAVEHLELTGVFAACHQAGVPCGAVLGVANPVGPGAHEAWKANHARVSRDLIQKLRDLGLFETA
jgi:purine-nucleoside phosphorylase